MAGGTTVVLKVYRGSVNGVITSHNPDASCQLQSVLRDIQRQSRTSIASSGLLEFRDERSWSPLLIASAKGHYKCAELVGSHILAPEHALMKQGKSLLMSPAGVQLARHAANVSITSL